MKAPSRSQAVDESIIPYSGRNFLRQWAKPKPVRYGIKVFCRCCSPIGYLQKMNFYLSKRHHTVSNSGLCFDTVNELCREIRYMHHVVFTDNMYTSVQLARFLYSKGIYLTGTLRSNRKLIPDILRQKKSKLQRGEHKVFQCTRLSNLTACIWRDTSDVKFLSTNCDPNATTNIVRRVASNLVEVPSPAVGVTYSRYFSAVDTMDSLITCRNYGGLGHSSKKYWRHIFFWLINVSISNAFILFKLESPNYKKTYDHMKFRLQIAEGLIGNFTSRKRGATLKRPIVPIIDTSGHSFVRMDCKRPKRCVGHRTFFPNEKPRDTSYGCFQCAMFFCKNCFPLAHTHK